MGQVDDLEIARGERGEEGCEGGGRGGRFGAHRPSSRSSSFGFLRKRSATSLATSPTNVSSIPSSSACTTARAIWAGVTFGGGDRLAPGVLRGADEDGQHAHAAGAQLRAQVLQDRQPRRRRRGEGAELGPARQRMDRQDVDEGHRIVRPVGAARAHAGPEGLGEAREAQRVDVELPRQRFDVAAGEDRAGADVLGIVDQDVDLAPDRAGEGAHALRVADVEIDERDPLSQRREGGLLRDPAPPLGDADEDALGAGGEERHGDGEPGGGRGRR